MKSNQPKIRKGTEFTGWATFNWGICHNRVFRTRKQAKQWCADSDESGDWDKVKDHFRVMKVKCIVI